MYCCRGKAFEVSGGGWSPPQPRARPPAHRTARTALPGLTRAALAVVGQRDKRDLAVVSASSPLAALLERARVVSPVPAHAVGLVHLAHEPLLVVFPVTWVVLSVDVAVVMEVPDDPVVAAMVVVVGFDLRAHLGL